MNYLLVRREATTLKLALCVDGPVVDCVLQGCIDAQGHGELADGPDVRLTSFEASSQLAGLGQALAWVSARNMRVDAVVHCGSMQGPQASAVRLSAALRLGEKELTQLVNYTACDEVEATYRVVSAWRAECAQLLYLTNRSVALPLIVESIVEQGLLKPPTSCPHRAKVRCENCRADLPA